MYCAPIINKQACHVPYTDSILPVSLNTAVVEFKFWKFLQQQEASRQHSTVCPPAYFKDTFFQIVILNYLGRIM
jgi:hypothetical protein